jgi:hypothetical protein
MNRLKMGKERERERKVEIKIPNDASESATKHNFRVVENPIEKNECSIFKRLSL